MPTTRSTAALRPQRAKSPTTRRPSQSRRLRRARLSPVTFQSGCAVTAVPPQDDTTWQEQMWPSWRRPTHASSSPSKLPCPRKGSAHSSTPMSPSTPESLNAKTGLFTKHMKIIHQDAKLHAQRVAAIKRTKGTAAARNQASEKQKAFFRDPENRLKRSIAKKGVKFYCSKCEQEGHRSFYCPTVREISARVQFRCRLSGGKGHNIRTCGNPKSENEHQRQPRHCSQCGEKGHNRRNCPGSPEVEVGASSYIIKKVNRHNSGVYSCSFCKEKGHNRLTCPKRNASLG